MIQDVVPGLWVWRLPYPYWREGLGWERVVSSTCVESGGEVVLLDPLAPPADTTEIWERLDARSPTVVVVLKPDHVRDVDLFVRRYGARAFGPFLFWRTDIPETELEAIQPGSELPGGLVALYDGRGRGETPMWLPVPALRALLELPFEYVIVSHGEPVHDRAAYERALNRPPWTGE